jgi:SMC interacting uncharacterized protein involved in chromosome segregation
MNNLKIKIDLSKGKFGVRKSYKKGDVVVCNAESSFIAIVIDMSIGKDVIVNGNKTSYNVCLSITRLATTSEKKLLGTRKFAEIEDISQVKKVIKEKEFPKQWRIKVTEENRNMLNQYKLSKGTMKLNEHWDWVEHTGNAFHSDAVANYKSYPIITTEQFRKHVLKSTPKEAENKSSEPTEVETLKAELETLKKQVSVFVDKYCQSGKEVERLEKELDSAKGRNMKLGSEINQLETKNSDYVERIDNLWKEIDKHETTIESLYKEIETITKYNVEQIKLILKNE